MSSEDLLQSKYDRLCVEFKKLRNRHHELKETTSKELALLEELRDNERKRNVHISNLEKECDQLRFRNAYLCKRVQELSVHPHHSLVENSSTQKDEDICAFASDLNSGSDFDHTSFSQSHQPNQLIDYGDLNIPEATHNILSKPSYAIQSSETSLSNNVFPVKTTAENSPSSPESANNCTVSDSFDGLSLILKDLTTTLRNWTSTLLSKRLRTDSSEVNQALVNRIADLERQVCELSLQCQLERKRRLMDLGQRDDTPGLSLSVDHNEPNSSTAAFESRQGYESLVIDGLQKRIRSLIDEAQHFAGLASFLQDEIRCLTPRIIGLAREAHFHRTEAAKSYVLIQQLRSELDLANSATLKQSNEMAKYIANLTDELQELRGAFGRNNSFDASTASSKRNTIFNVLKR